MELTVSGILTKEEIDSVIKQHIENKTGKKVKSFAAKVEGREAPEDWRAEYPLDYVLTGYSFVLENAQEETKPEPTKIPSSGVLLSGSHGLRR